MKKYFALFITLLLFISVACHQQSEFYIKGVAKPIISLNGTWKINLDSYDNINLKRSDSLKWNDIEVPGECMMQGYPIKHDEPFTYMKEITIPADFKNKMVKLRFEGVYSYAKVWIDGNHITDHSGGFTAWECDITEFVNPGKKSMLFVEVTDRADEISYASGYAKHPIGGILREVSLLGLPFSYPEQVTILTSFDDNYRNSILTVKGLTTEAGKDSKVEIELFNERNEKIKLQESSITLTGTEFKLVNDVNNPLKWDAEHPNLYRLKMTFTDNGKCTWQKVYHIGFREIDVQGNKLLINGKEVKLRGVCRHDIHPLLGRVSTPDYELKDVMLAKEANVNFIRTSHYPPTDNFLSLCDKYGLFVEDETAVCFVGSHRTADYYPGSSENSSEFTERYLSQLKEMVYDHRNHASVIIWSIGNENNFGSNFKKSYDWVKAADSSRPVIFSYPGNVNDSVKAFDLLSMHYPGINGDMNQNGIVTKSFGNEKMPVIFDEWAHVACYNNLTVKEDPNIRDFWGISLDSMWQKLYDANGGAGGAIWGMIDETFMLPADLPGYNEWWGKIDKNIIPATYTGHCIGYGEWGIIDTWRHKKPEFWNVKKAYSPVRLLNTGNVDFNGESISIEVYNRFDFTNLNEIKLKLTVEGESSFVETPDLPAHSVGVINTKIGNWPENETLLMEFIDANDNLIDSYNLSRNNEQHGLSISNTGGDTYLADDNKEYFIKCRDSINYRIDKLTGLFTGIEINNKAISFSGPFINIRTIDNQDVSSSYTKKDYYSGWKPEIINVAKKGKNVEVSVYGSNQGVKAVFNTIIYPDGTINTGFTASGLPGGIIREAGITFITDNSFDSLAWKRKPYWSSYPSDHLSAAQGKVALFPSVLKEYRKFPEKEWQFDSKSFFYNGIENEEANELTNISRATKENVIDYTLSIMGEGELSVYGDGKTACRIAKKDEMLFLYINNEIDYPDLSWGNYTRNIPLKDNYSGKVTLQWKRKK